MGNSKTYTVGFDVQDRLFSAKFDAIFKKIENLTKMVSKISVNFDSSSTTRAEASINKVTSAVEKSSRAFGSQKRTLDQAAVGFRSLADSMDRASSSHSRFGGILDVLKGKFGSLLGLADDFGDVIRQLSYGDFVGAARSGQSLMAGSKGLLASAGGATGGGALARLGAGALGGPAGIALAAGTIVAGASVAPSATWEKQVGRASKTALDESTGYTKLDLSAGMLNALMDVKGIDQQSLVNAVGQAGSLGYTNEESVLAATVGSKAGAAFELETSDAMRMLGVVNQMWAEQAEEIGGNIVMMEKAGSAVNVLGNKYASTESNILQFLSEAGGLAKTWEMDVAETAAIGSLLETVNIKASEGETMIRSSLNAGIFQRRSLPPDQLKAFKKAGIRPKGEMGYDIAGAMLDVSGSEYQEMLNENLFDTLLATTDAILEKAGGDNSLAQQMAEAVFGSYGMGFLKLGGQRENLAEMTGEAKKGFDAGTSMEEEYKRQTSNLSDTFGQTMKIIGALAKVIGSFLLPPLSLLLGLFNSILAPIAKFAIFFQNMIFKQIDKLTSKFMDSNLGKDLAKGVGALINAGAKIWAVIGPVLVKLIEGLLDALSGPVMTVLWIISSIYDKIRPYVLKLVEGILGILDELKGMWNWLMDAIPGARKEEARLKLEAAAKKEGLGVTAAGSIVTLDSRGNPTKIAPTTTPENLIDLRDKYQALPGFAEGIADAVKAGISSVGDTIAEKIAESLPDFPSFDDLTKTLEDLVVAIDNLRPEFLGGGKFDEVSGSRRESEETGDTYYQEKNSESGEIRVMRHRWGLPDDFIEDESSLPQDIKDAFGIGNAEGITFTGTGIYSGKFHGPEETLSRATTLKGPGIIDRALNLLDARSHADAGQRQVGDVHIHNETKIDLSGAKLDPGFDLEKLYREIDSRIEAGSTKAVMAALGQRRT